MLSTRPASDWETRSQELAREVGSLAARLGYEDAAAGIDATLTRLAKREVSLLVAGEMNRGKSSLLNALLGRKHLLPVDFHATTSVPAIVRHGGRERLGVWRRGADRPFYASIDELAQWGTVEGEQAVTSDADDTPSEVAGVEIELDHELLAKGLVLIDTPGVGGLDAAHAEITKQALAQADALLFVLDAQSPVSRHELDFLEEVRERVPTVLVAVTKTDTRGHDAWEHIVGEDRRLISERLDARADWHLLPVSSPLRLSAIDAAAEGQMEAAEELEKLSGFAALEREIDHRVIDRTRSMKVANVLYALGGVLERCGGDLHSRKAALGAEEQGDLAADAAGIASALEPDARWRSALATVTGRLARDLTSEEQRRREFRIVRPVNELLESRTEFSVETLAPDLDDELAATHMALSNLVLATVPRLLDAVEGVLDEQGLRGLLADIAPQGAALSYGGTAPASRPNLLYEMDAELVPRMRAAIDVGAHAVTTIAASKAAIATAGVTIAKAGATQATLAAGSSAAAAGATTAVVPAAAGGAAGGGALAPAASSAVVGTGGAVLGAGAGVAVIAWWAYRAHLSGLGRQGGQALERAVRLSEYVLQEHLQAVEDLETDLADVITRRAKERATELELACQRAEQQRQEDIREINHNLDELGALDAARSELRAALPIAAG